MHVPLCITFFQALHGSAREKEDEHGSVQWFSQCPLQGHFAPRLPSAIILSHPTQTTPTVKQQPIFFVSPPATQGHPIARQFTSQTHNLVKSPTQPETNKQQNCCQPATPPSHHPPTQPIQPPAQPSPNHPNLGHSHLQSKQQKCFLIAYPPPPTQGQTLLPPTMAADNPKSYHITSHHMTPHPQHTTPHHNNPPQPNPFHLLFQNNYPAPLRLDPPPPHQTRSNRTKPLYVVPASSCFLDSIKSAPPAAA